MKAIYFIICIIIPVSTSYSQSSKEFIKNGNEEYKNKSFNNSEINYRKALEKDKESTEAGFNLGDALYKQGKYDEASSQFQEIISKNTNDEIRAKAYHNLGNSLLKSKKFEESIEAYKNALKRSPGDEDSKYNLAYARAMLTKEQQNKKDKDNKEKKDNKNKQDENKDNKKDQEKKDQNKDNQNNEDNNKDKKNENKNDQKPDPEKISKEDAQRILDALNNREKDIQKKATKKQGTRVTIEKNW